jgi:hypothetical protein
MPNSSWFFLVYGAALFYLLLHRTKLEDQQNFRWAWFSYVVALFPGALSVFQLLHGFFVVVSWACVIVSATFLYFSIDPIFPAKADGKDSTREGEM